MPFSWMIRLLLVSTLITLGGCGMLQKSRLRYLGDATQVGETPPPGFSVSPSEAADIAILHNGRRKVANFIYHDDRNYYVCMFEGLFVSTRSTALEKGTVINGTTGEVYNRELGLWESDPRTEEGAEPSVLPIVRKNREARESLQTGSAARPTNCGRGSPRCPIPT
jgi:hypothetical protein